MKVFLFHFLILIPSLFFAQQTIEASILHDGIERDYILYVPEIYTGDEPVPLVFNFHGYTSNATQQMWYGDFRPIADTANFILIHPEGTEFDGNTHWNVGGFTIGSTVDDVGFTSALIDSLSENYNINQERIYSTGMSNGGFMSFLLACQLGEKIAAVASVTGSMTPETFNNCEPSHPTPILQIHGTTDLVVPYNGAIWTKPIEEVIDYWVEFNNCDDTPSSFEIPDVDLQDGSTAEQFVYENGENKTSVEHYEVSGGGHTWPGTGFPSLGTNQDFNASEEIWRFFSQYDINGLIELTTNTNEENTSFNLALSPNPAKDILNVEHSKLEGLTFEIFSINGAKIKGGKLNAQSTTIVIEELKSGVYYFRAGEISMQFIKQ